MSMCEFLVPTPQENEHLRELDDCYKRFNEMDQAEREFLNALVLRRKPKKLLELGTSAGGSAVVMLNAVKGIDGAALHSIDYNKKWYRDYSKDSGWVVGSYPAIRQNWKLHTGGMAFKFIEGIGGGIEFALIDTVHHCPGEILDTLMVLPFLSDDAVVCFHDTNYHTLNRMGRPGCRINGEFVNNLLSSALFGDKVVQGDFDRGSSRYYFPNITAVKLSRESKEHIFELFNLLTLKWSYLPKEDEMLELADFFEGRYGSYFAGYFRDVCVFQKSVITVKDRIGQIANTRLPPKIKKIIKKFM